MKLPTLYSRTSTGATQQWTVETDGSRYRMISGQFGGKLVSSEWTVCAGKNLGRANETTPEQQAAAEAKSKWDKKLKTGYAENRERIDECMTYVEPMLAKNLKDRISKVKWPVLVQNKFNGFRCIATLENEKVVLKSRKGELYVSVPHINEDLKSFFADHPNAVLDGELFNNDLRQSLNEISKLVRKSVHATEEDLKRSAELVLFYIYDGYSFEGRDENVIYEHRKAWIDENLPRHSKTFRAVTTNLARSMEEVDKIFGAYVADGQEGVMVRLTGSVYEHGRSAGLLKWKPLDSAEATITAINEGTGNWAGTGKIITLNQKGVIFDATFKGTWEEAVQFLKDKDDWIGKEVTFQYNGFTGKKIPNYARVDINNCLEGDK